MHLKSYHIVLLALIATLFARLVVTAGAPNIINFVHFVLVPVVFALVYPKIRSPYCLQLVWIMMAFLGAIVISAYVSGAAIINVALDFILLVEPFLLLIAIVGISWSDASIKRFRYWLLLFASLNVGLAYLQYFVLPIKSADDVKGIYMAQGAGHHIAGAIALSAAVYFFVDFPGRSRWLRVAVAAFFAPVVLFSDAKQAIAVFFISLLIMGLLNMFTLKVRKGFVYLAIAAIGVGIAEGIVRAGLDTSFRFWTRPDYVSEGLETKLLIFSTLASHYTSSLDWLVGLGPGHTIGRLGQMFKDYDEYLRPLGATSTNIAQEVFTLTQQHWISNIKTGSSLWIPRFSWAGVWGDLGLLGLAIYLYLWFTVLRRFCPDDLSRFLIITILVFGAVFDWMEEPGYVLFIMALVGLRWQEHQHRGRTVRQEHLKKPIPAGYGVGTAARPVAYERLIRQGPWNA